MFEILSGLKEMAIVFCEDKLIYANEAAQYYFNSYIYTLTGADISSFFSKESYNFLLPKLKDNTDFTTKLTLYGGEEKTFSVKFIKDDFERDTVAFFETDKGEELNKNILRASANPKSVYDPLSVGKGEIYSNDIGKIAETVYASASRLTSSAVIKRNRSLCDEVEKLVYNLNFLVERAKKYIKELSSPEGDLIIAKRVFSLNEMLKNLLKRTENYIKIENLDITVSYTEREPDIKISGAYYNLLKAVAGLIHNAIEYVLASGRRGRILVSLKTEGERAVIEISDNGIGLSENTFNHINGEDTDISCLSGENKSTVLNYQVISTYIQLNNGSLYVDNRKDKGSVAVIKLPLFSETYSSLRFVGELYGAENEIDIILKEGIIHI